MAQLNITCNMKDATKATSQNKSIGGEFKDYYLITSYIIFLFLGIFHLESKAKKPKIHLL